MKMRMTIAQNQLVLNRAKGAPKQSDLFLCVNGVQFFLFV